MNLQFFKSACRMFATETKEKVPFVKQSLLQRVLHIRKVSRVNSGGKIRSISALVVVGNQNGSAGYGMGRGTDTATAVQKALVQAQKNLQPILRLDNRTIYSDIEYQYHRVNLTLRTAKPGHGVVANNYIHEICRCVGITDLTAKVIGSKNPLNVIKGTFEALRQQKTPTDIARMRGKKVVDVESMYYGTQFTK